MQTNSIIPEMDKVFHEPLQILAIKALCVLVPDGPTSKSNLLVSTEIAQWQAWWRLNKSKFQSTDQ